MRPVIPALAALAWGEPRRRAYWEQELLNALVIIERGWSTPQEMRGSWAGAMGHTQWMPEVWLNMGVDYDGDGRVSPFGKPDDALAGTAQYLVKRGKYRRGEHWGYEVRAGRAQRRQRVAQLRGLAESRRSCAPTASHSRSPAPPRSSGCRCRAARPSCSVPNFYAVRSYNPSMNYTLSIVLLGDRIMGGGPFVQPFPGGERTPTLGRGAGNPEAPDRARLRYRRHRRTGRQRHHDRRPQFPAQSRHGAGRRLCRGEAAGTVASGPLIRFYGALGLPRTQGSSRDDCKSQGGTGRRKIACDYGSSVDPRARAAGQSDRHECARFRQRRGRRHVAGAGNSVHRAQSRRELSRACTIRS